MTSPQISVVIPTHNRRALLEEMLIALAAQTFPAGEFEVVVVIDGGQDETAEMLREMKTPYSLRPVSQEQTGVAAARNRGAGLASGLFLVFLDDDLLPQPDLLAEHAEAQGRDDGAVVLGMLLPAGNTPTLGHAVKGGWNLWEERVLCKHYRAVAQGRRPPAGRRLYSGNFSIRAEHFWSVGGFDETLQRGEDVDLGLRLERLGLRFHFNPRAAAVHRGFRTFRSWRASAYLYGRTDVRLSTRKGFSVLPELFRWYCRQPALARRVVDLCCDRPMLRQGAIWGLRTSSATLTRLGAHGLAHVGYSGIYKLEYWQGVADELGGKNRLDAGAREWRRSLPVEGPAA